MTALLVLQWFTFASLAMVWTTFCGANLLILFSDRNASYLPFVGAIAGALAALVVPEAMSTTSRLMLAVVLFAADPFWLASPLQDARAWLQRR